MKLYNMPVQDDLSAISHSGIYRLMFHKMSRTYSVVSHLLPVEASAKVLLTFLFR